MSIGKKSIARAASAAAKAEVTAAEVASVADVTEIAPEPITAEEPKKQVPAKFKKISVGEKMPDFLL